MMKFRLLPYLAALLAVAAVLTGVWLLERSEQQRFEQYDRVDVLNQLSTVRARLEAGLSERIFLARGLTALVANNPNLEEEKFVRFSQAMLAGQTGIDLLSLVKDTTIAYVYPRLGNEEAVGVDLLTTPEHREAVQQAIATGNSLVTGPVRLISGRVAIIYRTPISIAPTAESLQTQSDTKDGSNTPSSASSAQYWGLAQVIVSADRLYRDAGLLKPSAPLNYALRGKDGLGASGEVFFGEPSIFDQNPVVVDVSLPNGSWQLAAIPAGGWLSTAPSIVWVRTGGGLLALVTGVMVFSWVSYPTKLRSNVKEATMALRDSEAKYRELVDNASSMILRLDTQGNITFFNEFAQAFFGYSEEEILGQNAVGTILPETYDSGNELIEMVKDSIENPQNYTYHETEHIRRQGERVCWVAWRNKVLQNETGGFTGLLCIGTDISDRKHAEMALRESEAELRALFAAMTDVILVLDTNGRYIKIAPTNPHFLYKPKEEILNKTIHEFLPSEQADFFLSQIQQAVQTQQMRSFEYKLEIGAAEVWFAVRVSPILQDKVLWVARNISDSKLAEMALQQAKDELELHVQQRTAQLQEANEQLQQEIVSRDRAQLELRNSEAREREKAEKLEQTLQELRATQSHLIQSEKMSSLGQLIAGISHEINNPVNFIHGNLTHTSGYVEDLLDLVDTYEQEYPQPTAIIADKIDDIDLDFLKEDFEKLIASMQAGTERIRDIVLSLRNFSRLDESDMKRVDIHEGIESTLLILQHRLSPIEVVKQFGNLPKIECYAGQLNQVFLHLLSNAIDAIDAIDMKGLTDCVERETTPGKITIDTAVHPDRERAIVSITDDGIGMSEDVKSQVFNPFFTTKKVGDGSGLGLSTSYQIVVEQHHGEISCISEPSRGTTFTIEIPI